MSKSAKFAIGAFIGGVAGLVAGLLTAPKSGRDTRADIRQKADELKADASHKVDQAKAEVDFKKAELEAEARNLKHRADRAVEGAKDGFSKKNK